MMARGQDWAALCRRYRNSRGLKQEAMATDFGVDQSTISRWESSRQEPNFRAKQAILAEFHEGVGLHPDVSLRLLLDESASPIAVWSRAGILLGVSPPWREEMLRHGNVDDPIGKHVDEIHDTQGLADRYFAFLEEKGFFEGKVALSTLRFRPFVNPDRAEFGGTTSFTSLPVVLPHSETGMLQLAGHDVLEEPPDEVEMAVVTWIDHRGVHVDSI